MLAVTLTHLIKGFKLFTTKKHLSGYLGNLISSLNFVFIELATIFLTFRIRNAQMRDEGIYECQISTQPVRSLFVNLRVVGENQFLERLCQF